MTALGKATAAAVRAHAASRGARQVDIAEILGITQAQVSRRLTGTVPFTLEDLERLAPYFEVTVAELLDPPASLVDDAPAVES